MGDEAIFFASESVQEELINFSGLFSG